MSEQSTDATAQQGESIELTLSEGVEEDLKAKEPSESEKKRRLREHRHHLVRSTTSKLSVEPAVSEGVEATATAEVPDTYCFICEEWIGTSGVELRGTPRSKADAYYLGGKPADVRAAENGTRDTLEELADALTERVEHIEDRSDAYEFVEAELERAQSSTGADQTEADRDV